MSGLRPTGFLSRSEAAEALRCSPLTISRMISAGRIRASKVARKVLIPVEEVRRIVKAGEMASIARSAIGTRVVPVTDEMMEVLKQCPFRNEQGQCTVKKTNESN